MAPWRARQLSGRGHLARASWRPNHRRTHRRRNDPPRESSAHTAPPHPTNRCDWPPPHPMSEWTSEARRLPQRTAPILARGACIISISYACGTFLRSIFPKSNSGGLIRTRRCRASVAAGQHETKTHHAISSRYSALECLVTRRLGRPLAASIPPGSLGAGALAASVARREAATAVPRF